VQAQPSTRQNRLTSYDIACGSSINAAFAWFQGMDPVPTGAQVFALLSHRMTGGEDDGSHNPLLAEGAGWAGYVGTRGERTVFASLVDGCRAAALALQFREFQSVQIAYRARDAARLAAAIEMSALRNQITLAGFTVEVDELVGNGSARDLAPSRHSILSRIGEWGRKRSSARA
jgi:hypothetical protein